MLILLKLIPCTVFQTEKSAVNKIKIKCERSKLNNVIKVLNFHGIKNYVISKNKN